jgi:hypothetical protein
MIKWRGLSLFSSVVPLSLIQGLDVIYSASHCLLKEDKAFDPKSSPLGSNQRIGQNEKEVS